MRKWILWLAVASICLASFSVYAQEETPSPESTPDMAMTDELSMVTTNPWNLTADSQVALVRFAHTTADYGPVDVYVRDLGDTQVAAGLAFGTETGFVLLPAGEHAISVRSAGSGVAGEILATTSWNFQNNTTWLVAFAGLEANVSLQLEPINLLRDNINADVARVRLVNFIPGGPALTVTDSTGETFGQGMGWFGVVDSERVPGDYALNVTSADGTTLVADVPVTLWGGALTTLMIMGSTDGSQPVQLISFSSPGNVSRVQFVNNYSEMLQVFMIPGNVEIVPSLAIGATSEWVTLPSGAVTFVTYIAGAGPTSQQQISWIGRVLPMRDLVITLLPDRTADEGDPVFSPTILLVAPSTNPGTP